MSVDGKIKIWETASGKERYTFTGCMDTPQNCVFSSDGTWMAYLSKDLSVKIHEVVTSMKLVDMPLLGEPHCMALHPWLPLVVCGDLGGSLYILEVEGIPARPIIVTAIMKPQSLIVRCPACQQNYSIDHSALGSELACPAEGCGQPLKVNPFVIQMA
jgi:WD40 repeat protein